MSKWTPGPWRKTGYDRDVIEIPLKGFFTEKIGYQIVFVNGHREEEAQANAHLIAAAPELYEALEKMCKWHEIQATWDKGDNGYYAAMKALAKARGEE